MAEIIEIKEEISEGNNPGNMSGDNGNQEKEIDLVAIVKKLWVERKRICIWCGVAAVLGLIVAFSIPKEYTTYVKLSPEDGSAGGNSLSGLAAMAGINMGQTGDDAVSPMLYPDVISSVPFGLSLLDIPLENADGTEKFTLEEYLTDDMKSPWWSVITGAPGLIIDAVRSIGKDDDEEEQVVVADPNGPIRITREQYGMLNALNGLIETSVDQKTLVISIAVTMQDPLVSAAVADTVTNRLQEFITSYRTQKARQDLEYIERLNDEAKEKYYTAQQKYANYLDTHQGLVMYSAQTMRERLQNEATLAFNLYNQTSSRLEVARAKVQEQTPVYATIEPATVPIIPSKPRKVLILAGFIFLGFVACAAWIIFGRPLVKTFRETKVEE